MAAGEEPHVARVGAGSSAVSRGFVAKTETHMKEWLARDLSEMSLVVLMIDGVYIADHVMLVAVGIDVSCTALLSDLVERGLRTGHAILAVLDAHLLRGPRAPGTEVEEAGRAEIQARITSRGSATSAQYLVTGRRVLELAKNAKALFDRRTPRERLDLLQRVACNPRLDSRTVRYDLRKPFATLAEMAEDDDWRPQGDSDRWDKWRKSLKLHESSSGSLRRATATAGR